MFGYSDPKLDDYDIAGYNLGDIRDNLRIKRSNNVLQNADKKPTVTTLFRNDRKKSTKSLSLKKALAAEFDRYSISKSVAGKVKSFVTDLKEKNIYFGISKDSKLNLSDEEKEKFKKLADKYEKENQKNVDNYLRSLEGNEKLKDKLSSQKLKQTVSKNINKILSQGKDRILSQDKLKDVVKNLFPTDKEIFTKQLDFLKNQDSKVLKKKLELNDSKLKLFNKMGNDIKEGKFSVTAIPSKIIKGKKNIQKEDLPKILNYYKLQQKQKKEHYPFVKQSKLKQLKSDLRAKIGF